MKMFSWINGFDQLDVTLDVQLDALATEAGRVAGRALVAARVDGAQVGEGEHARVGVYFTHRHGRQHEAAGLLMAQQADGHAVLGPAKLERLVAQADAAQQSRADALLQHLLFRLAERLHPRRNCV